MFDLIGIDWGEKYFGIAFGSSLTKLVIPANKVFLASSINLELKNEIISRSIKTIVIGYPTTFSGGKTRISDLVDDFKKDLQNDFPNLDIYFFDERGSSKDSETLVKNTDLSHNLAAKIILERWLEKFSE